jgi:hypothetical protein
MLKRIFIILSKSEIRYIPKTSKNIFTFSPLLCKEVKNYKFNVYCPNPDKTAISSETRLEKIQKFSDLIIESIKNFKIFQYMDEYEELLAPYLQVRFSTFFYIKDSLPESNKYYLFINGNWSAFEKKIDAVIQIEKKLAKQSIFNKQLFDIGDTFDCPSLINYLKSIINKILGLIQKLIFKFFISNTKEIFVLSDTKSYFLPKIKKSLRSKNKMTISLVSWQNIPGKVKSILKLLISIFSKNRISDSTFFLEPIIGFKIKDIKKQINYALADIFKEDQKYIQRLILDISTYLVLTDGYQKYLYSLIDKKNIKKSVLHATRYSELYALASIMSLKSSKVFLISHGTHTVQKNNYLDLISNKQLALALLYSKLKNIIHCSQSLFSDDYFLDIKFKFKKINHLSIVSAKKSKVRKSKFRILHASTIKPFNTRTYYYETSFEYISGIKLIAKKLDSLSNELEIIVRPRFLKELVTYDYLQDELLEFGKFVKISDNKEFLTDIKNCDCLISLSSTTLEQAFNMGIPCLSYGFTKYNHFGSYSHLNIDKKHYDFKILNAIEKKLGRQFIYSNNPEFSRQDFLEILLD